MKKSKLFYLLADILTISGFGFAGLIVWLTFLPSKAVDTLVILGIAALGEARDALDGTLARYARRLERQEDPDSPKPERKLWVVMDQVADIALALAICYYNYCHTEPQITVAIVIACIPCAVLIQLIRWWNLWNRRQTGEQGLDECVERLVIVRRMGYFIALLIQGMLLCIYSTFPVQIRIAVMSFGLIAVAMTIVLKFNRLKEDKTPIE